MRKPSPFATSSRASLIAVKGTAAMLSVDTDNSQEQSHSDAMVSPVAGLPVQPERGMLHGPLATLQLVLHRVELTPQPSKGWWVVLKVGPHWARSSVRRSLEFAWQLSVPIYHPTTTLILVVFEEAGRGKLNFLGKLQYRISYLMYLNKREVIKSLKLRVSGSSSQQQQHPNGGCSSNSMDASQLGAQTGGGAGSQISGVVLLGFTCSIPDRGRLLNAYERSPYPPTVHYISLFHAASRDSIIQSHHHKVVNWLSKEADPPIPPVAAWKVLETGRDKFKLARARHNIQRLKAATSWVPAIHGYFIDLKAWVRPTHNIISVIIMAAVCFRPMVTLFAFLLWRSVVALRRLLMHRFVEYLGVDLGELFDSAGLLPTDLLYYDDDNDDDAASTTSTSSSIALSAGSSSSGPGNSATRGGGWGGNVRDSAAVMMFQPKRLKALKRRYEQLLRIALQVGAHGPRWGLGLACGVMSAVSARCMVR
eukprot:GHRR01021732.1.p1 GENE.GHRR01021732.1~~GHRR01021732.1.p1  ORF type:complete len:479 (+),score=167.79 GHRR01021732.1:339-1775(+)